VHAVALQWSTEATDRDLIVLVIVQPSLWVKAMEFSAAFFNSFYSWLYTGKLEENTRHHDPFGFTFGTRL
jgi:hypothetical protein